MGVVNAELLAKNLERVNGLAEVFSSETIASAMRDRTGVSTITAEKVDGFLELANLGSKKMLISAKQEKKLNALAGDAQEAATAALAQASTKESKEEEVI